jgi:hypothetical protein
MMTRRKGEVTKSQIDRECPHQVAILIPVGGLVRLLMDMYTFCDAHAMSYRTRTDRRRELVPSGHVRFCFADPAHADAFHAKFDGERITIEQQARNRH